MLRAEATTEKGLLESLDTIERASRKVLGIVLVGTRETGRGRSYYSDHYQTS